MLRSQGILAGVPFFDEVFRQLDCSCVVRTVALLTRTA